VLSRHYPQPIPAIHPIPEYLATGQRKRWYEEMKADLDVPWMGVVTMAYAHYPNFFEAFWAGVRPLVKQPVFAEQCRALRSVAQDQAQLLGPQSLAEKLHALGYAERELEDIRAVAEVFSHGNFPYLLLATIVRLLLEEEEFGVGPSAPYGAGQPAPYATLPMTPRHSQRPALMEAHHADAATRTLYEDIKSTLRLPFVNTDYRALARWPSYFAIAWKNLRVHIARPEYEACCRHVHEHALNIVTEIFANPGGLSSRQLREAAAQDGDTAEILQVARLFQWLLPGLVINVAYMRAELGVTPI
jgi:hypothetical protein